MIDKKLNLIKSLGDYLCMEAASPEKSSTDSLFYASSLQAKLIDEISHLYRDDKKEEKDVPEDEDLSTSDKESSFTEKEYWRNLEKAFTSKEESDDDEVISFVIMTPEQALEALISSKEAREAFNNIKPNK